MVGSFPHSTHASTIQQRRYLAVRGKREATPEKLEMSTRQGEKLLVSSIPTLVIASSRMIPTGVHSKKEGPIETGRTQHRMSELFV